MFGLREFAHWPIQESNTLTASTMTQAIYAAIVLAALARTCSALEPVWSELLLHITASPGVLHFSALPYRLAMPVTCDHCKECRERSVWFAPFQPLPHGEPQPCAGALSGKRAFGPTPAIRMTRSRPINRCTEVASVTSKKVP